MSWLAYPLRESTPSGVSSAQQAIALVFYRLSGRLASVILPAAVPGKSTCAEYESNTYAVPAGDLRARFVVPSTGAGTWGLGTCRSIPEPATYERHVPPLRVAVLRPIVAGSGHRRDPPPRRARAVDRRRQGGDRAGTDPPTLPACRRAVDRRRRSSTGATVPTCRLAARAVHHRREAWPNGPACRRVAWCCRSSPPWSSAGQAVPRLPTRAAAADRRRRRLSDRGPLPRCPRAARAVDRRRPGQSAGSCGGASPRPSAPRCRSSPDKLVIDRGPLPCCPRAARAVDHRRPGHRPGKLSRAFPAPVLARCRSSPAPVIDRGPLPRCPRAADRRRPGHRPGKLFEGLPLRWRPGVGADRRRRRSSTGDRCHTARVSPMLSMPREAGHRPGDRCHAARVPPVLSIVAGLVIGRATVPACRRAARAVDRRRASWSSSGDRCHAARVSPVLSIVAGLVIDRATVPTCRRRRPCCRSSPGKLADGPRVPPCRLCCRSSPPWSSAGQRAAAPHVLPRRRSSPAPVIDRGPLPRCPRAARAVDRRRPGQSAAQAVEGLPRGRVAPGVDRRRTSWSSSGDRCHAARVSPVLSIVAGLVIDRATVPTCRRAARAVDHRRASWPTVPACRRVACAVDRRRPGHRPGSAPRLPTCCRAADRRRRRLSTGDRCRAAHVPPVLSIVAGLVNQPRKLWRGFPAAVLPPVSIVAGQAGHRPGTVAVLPTCRPCCRSSPAWSSTGQAVRGPSPRGAARCRSSPAPVIDRGPLPRCPRAADRRRPGHRPGKLFQGLPRAGAVRGADRRRRRSSTGDRCHTTRVSPMLSMPRASWSSTGDRCHAARVPPVLSIVAGLVIGRATVPACRRAARAVDRRRASWSSSGDRCHAARVSPVLSIVAGLVIDRATRHGSPRAAVLSIVAGLVDRPGKPRGNPRAPFSRIAAGRSRE